MSTLYVYTLTPIDFKWEHLTHASIVADRLYREMRPAIKAPPDRDNEDTINDFFEFIDAWGVAANQAIDAGYGDPRETMGGAVFWLPAEELFECAFAFKELNNGTTYVVSPYPLPHLHGDNCLEAREVTL
jgi:hypothetical protein